MRASPIPLVGALLLAAVANGCSARPGARAGALAFQGAASAAPRAVAVAPRPARLAPRSGFARLPSSVVMREDAPDHAPLYPTDPAAFSYSNAPGPAGSTGSSIHAFEGHAYEGTMAPYEPYSPYGYGYGYGGYYAPGGAVPPGLRTPTENAAPSSAWSQPFAPTFSSGDVSSHRPGLSTGNGIFGR